MAELKLPLSGNVSQLISPWTAWFSALGSQIGLVNIHLGESSAPEVERDILNEVGSYGKQLGRVGDVLIVLLNHFRPQEPLKEDEMKAITALRAMLDEIATIKESHNRQTMRPSWATFSRAAVSDKPRRTKRPRR
jgi:hypothetical protein